MFEQSTSDARPENPEPKTANPHKIRISFYRLATDWIDLRTHMPTPAHTNNGRKSQNREYGHPAEWASDKAAHITAIFHDWHELLAEARNETPPPATTTAEIVQVTTSWQYLEPRIEHLCHHVEPEALDEITRLHNQIRHILGHTNPPHRIITPCTNCGLRTLLRHTRVGQSYVQSCARARR